MNRQNKFNECKRRESAEFAYNNVIYVVGEFAYVRIEIRYSHIDI